MFFGQLSISSPFQSTRPVWGGTRALVRDDRTGIISIHPPHAGRDFLGVAEGTKTIISIHPPHAGRDCIINVVSTVSDISIHRPMRGGTSCNVSIARSNIFQSTHPMRGGTPEVGLAMCFCKFQSTHPMRGGTGSPPGSPDRCPYFNPPAPCGAGRGRKAVFSTTVSISIHPPRAGRNSQWQLRLHRPNYFNPPAPWGRDMDN